MAFNLDISSPISAGPIWRGPNKPVLEDRQEHQDQLVSAIQDEQDHLASAPTSEQAEEYLDIENHSLGDETNEPDDEVSHGKEKFLEDSELGEGSQNEDDLQVLGEERKIEVVTLSSESDEEVQSGERQWSSNTCDSESTESVSRSSLDSEDEVDQENDEVDQEERSANQQDASRASESSGDGYSSTSLRTVDVPVREICPYDWVSDAILKVESLYQSGHNMGSIMKKISRNSNRIWRVEGMKVGEHLATCVGELKFIMYHVKIRDMNNRPPFAFVQQTILTRLNVAPS